jgi:APA family basic amino acid/polyamine antiporter
VKRRSSHFLKRPAILPAGRLASKGFPHDIEGGAGRGVDHAVTDPESCRKHCISSTSSEKRPVTLFSATLIVIANMIGTGVFTTLGLQLDSLPSVFAVLLLWVLGGVAAFCGALCYGELGAMMPRSGGEYTFLSDIYHPALGFLSGWVSIVAGFAAPIALAALALGEYSAAIFPGLDKTVLAVSAIVILSIVHLTDVKFGCYFQNFFTVGKICLLVSFIVLGFFLAQPQDLTLLPVTSDLKAVISPAFAISLVYVFYAYSGWNSASYIAGEIQNPERNLPLSLFIGTAIVSLFYVLINFIFLYTVPIHELAGQIDVGYLSAKAIFGRAGGTIMTFLICLALISSLSSLIMVGPRVTQAMSQDGKFFAFFSLTNRRGAPAAAIVLQSSVAILLTLTATFNAVLTYVGFTLALCSCLAVLGVILLRIKDPKRARPFKAWGYPATPAVFLLLYGWMLCYLFIDRPLPSTFGLLTVASGLVFYKLLSILQPGNSHRKII